MPSLREHITTLALVVAALSGCANDPPPHTQRFPALGTLVGIEIHGTDEANAAAASTAVRAYLQTIERDWYAYADGELGRINAALARGEPAPVSPDLAELINRALEFRERSNGYFDPAVGLLVELWGFDHPDAANLRPPDDARLQAWLDGHAQRAQLIINEGIISAPGPLKLDLGGIAKGTVLGSAIGILREYGIDQALVDLGGDVQVNGYRGQRQWRVGIRDPRGPGVLATIDLEPGEAIVSSGDYERGFEYDGIRYHHLLDPFSARPVTHTAGTSVIHSNPELADAAATALMAAGPGHFDALTAQLGITYALLITSDGDWLATDALRARLNKPAPSATDFATRH